MFSPELLEGEHLKLHISFWHGRVVLDFGKAISHLEVEPQEAEDLACLLMKHATNARVGKVLSGDTESTLASSQR